MSFETAYEIGMKIEGGYSNDPDDMGGETYKGISRKYHPSWPGWAYIDHYKSIGKIHEIESGEPDLEGHVRLFYKAFYWDPWRGDQVAELAPAIALKMFNIALNPGLFRAVTYLQTALNAFNRNELLYPDLVADGVFGPKTFACLKKYLETDKPEFIVDALKIQQGMHYLEYMKKSPIQEKYARGWFERATA